MENKNIYQKAQEVWDARMGSALKEKRSWQLATFICLSLLSFSVVANIYLGQKAKYLPYVVSIKDSGETKTVDAAASIDSKALDRATKFFLSRFVMLAREIPADAVLLRANMGKLFQLVSMQGKQLLIEKFKEQSPSQEFMQKNRALKIDSVLEISKGLYQLDWFEAEYDKDGQKLIEYAMRGTFKIAYLDPASEAQVKENPLGIFVDYFSWTKVGG